MGELGNNSTTLTALFCIVIMHLYSYQVSIASCIKQERESLLRLKASFIDSSNRLASWKGTDCCIWIGVGCNQTGGHVVKLDLRNYQYRFSSALVSNGIDSSLFELKYLNYLDLSANSFNYTYIPDYFSSTLELRYLNLSFTYFSGGIPRSLENLTKLLVLDFNHKENFDVADYFYMTKLFTDNLGWISSLSSLEYLDLSGVKVHSNLDLVQVLNNLPSLLSFKVSSCDLQNTPSYTYAPLNSSFNSKLQHLDLSYNMFGGQIPYFLQNMTSLRFLYLSGNGFNSSIPLWFGNLRNLVVLSLGFNLFTNIEGGLVSIIRNNCHLKELDLSNNHFLGGDVFGSHESLSAGCKDYGLEKLVLENIKSGTFTILPNWLGQLKNLKFLYLHNSSLYGPIPASLGNLSSLKYLDISYNTLSGAIPTSVGKLVNLGYLSLRDNNLGDVIPESFGQLQNLEGFDFSNNVFEGVLSEIHFANLSRLGSVYITENDLLSFEMKHNWVPPFQLKEFSVRSTKGFGTNEFPRWLGIQKEMSYLNLFNTNILGPIPSWLRFQNLRFLDLSFNQITGSLPKRIDDQMPNLIGIFISNAHINGTLPQSLCRLKNLMLLVLSDNTLSGTIPSCLLTPNLDLLDLSLNNFSGFLPIPSQNLSSLEVLQLAKNNLEGDPFDTLRSCKALSVLDVEGNRFSGNIPAWVGKNFSNLQILNLRGNMFKGTIPSTLWLLRRLQILILADNKLEGNIPPNFGNFSASPGPITDDELVCNSTDDPYAVCYVSYVSQVMKSSNLNYSYLQLYSMVNIDLSNNSLYGNIPSGITTVKGLFGLNLSHNNLSGTIPVEIGRTVSLQSLDLSSNQLFGSIPSNLASLDSLGVLKLSNNNFSGRIPRDGHLSTFNDASSFEGNPYLCGDPLYVKCPSENSGKSPAGIENFDDHDSHDGDKYEKMWFRIIMMLGYALGFWGVVGALILKRTWRHAYFHFIDELKDNIHIAILLNMTRLKQRMRGNNIFHQ